MLYVCPIWYCSTGAFHLEPLDLFVLWWCCLLCCWHQCAWNLLLEGCVLEKQRVNASHWLKVQFVTRFCYRANAESTLSLKWAKFWALMPGEFIKACVCLIQACTVFCLTTALGVSVTENVCVHAWNFIRRSALIRETWCVFVEKGQHQLSSFAGAGDKTEGYGQKLCLSDEGVH